MKILALPLSALLVSFGLQASAAGISYSSMGSVYSENFDSLPTDAPNNANIETVYPDGWRDDTTTVAGQHVSVPGWYLYHSIAPSSENGYNGNQRFRMGPGGNTGSFWGFGAAASNPEKALGSIGSTTTSPNGVPMYMALRLVNNTGRSLHGFTVTYDGEQWRDGQSPDPETLLFDYSLSATDADWNTTAAFTAVPALNFTSPVSAGIGTSGTAVDGNAAGKVPGITAYIGGITWGDGAELWLRWGDPQLASNADDGLAIDNFSFSAVPEPSALALILLGAAGFLVRRRR